VRTENEREEKARAAYQQAAEAYAFFARLRFLEADEVSSGRSGDRLLLIGTNEASAKRFNVPLDTTGTGTWADTGDALKSTHAFAEQQLAEAEGLVTGKVQ
jgi:hypothetical protein